MHAPRKISLKVGLKKNIAIQLLNLVLFPRRCMFNSFRRSFLPMSKPYDSCTIAKANDEFDCFISGSDQVFNLKLTGGDSSYFLDFVSDNKRKVSYAASCGSYAIEESDITADVLKRFDALSVREKTTANAINNTHEIDSTVVCDPVFLLTKEQWKKNLGITSKTDEAPYLLVYALFDTPQLYSVANAIAKEKGLKTIVITRLLRISGSADKIIRNVSPTGFASLLYNADYIVTNSFHGTSFSIIFEKPFCTFVPPEGASRVTDLLDAFDLQDRAYTGSIEHLLETPEYSERADRYEQFRNSGRSFLERVLEIN